MSDSASRTTILAIDWRGSVPVFRYVLGSCFILAVSSLLNYDLAYLTSVLSLGYLAPGAKPLTFKQSAQFITVLIVITGLAVIFSTLFLDYPIVFMPLLLLSLLWLYYTDSLPMMIKLFSLISMVIIPFVSIHASAIGSFIAVSLVFNAFMAVVLTKISFLVFPLTEADRAFEKEKDQEEKQDADHRFIYARNIIIILAPVLVLFYMFQWSSVLVLTFIAILSVSPALANPKVGMGMIAANILGGLFGILAYQALVMAPNFTLMILLTLSIGLVFGSRLFSDHKLAAIFGSGFSTFLLILGSVTSSEDEAGGKVWSRVIQIGVAVIYVVVAMWLLDRVNRSKPLQE